MSYRSELDSQRIASDGRCPSGPLVLSSLSEQSFKLLHTQYLNLPWEDLSLALVWEVLRWLFLFISESSHPRSTVSLSV